MRNSAIAELWHWGRLRIRRYTGDAHSRRWCLPPYRQDVWNVSPDNDARGSTMSRTVSPSARQKSDLLQGKPVSVWCLKHDALSVAYVRRWWCSIAIYGHRASSPRTGSALNEHEHSNQTYRRLPPAAMSSHRPTPSPNRESWLFQTHPAGRHGTSLRLPPP